MHGILLLVTKCVIRWLRGGCTSTAIICKLLECRWHIFFSCQQTQPKWVT